MAAEDLLDLLERLTAMGAALAGVFRGDREGRQQATRDRSGRHLSILYLDIAGYTEHGEACDERSHNSWARAGLDLAAQWTRAFGGRERPERRGDDIVVEFAEDGDATVLAAAVVQSHTRALRSTGIDSVAWRFHAGVDCGAVEEQHGDVFGRCLNRAAKIAKRGDGKTDASLVILTQEARERCSPDFRETPIAELGESVSLGEGEQYEVRPVTVSSASVLTRYVGRLGDAAGRLATELQHAPAEEQAVSSVRAEDQEQTRPVAAEET
jgi:class 3 adenylate cyclase